MASNLAGKTRGGAGDQLAGIVATRGSAAHPFVRGDRLTSSPQSSRNVADALYFLSVLHGRCPGAVDHAAGAALDRDLRLWLERAADAFAGERALLARLVAAAGPVPSTPGAADSDVVLHGQQHAVETLARSERKGCSLGAAFALLLDWGAMRRVLDAAAARFGVSPHPYPFNDPAEVIDIVAAVPPEQERALLFGGDQIILHHYGLWDLLEARADARAG